MILLTGGAGFIGSHTALDLIGQGEGLVIFDNFSSSKPSVIDRIEKISGKPCPVHEGDMLDRSSLKSVFDKYDIDSVIHFAGLKAVGESVANPLPYYHTNVTGSVNLFETMAERGIKKLIFSSSATVYGGENKMPLTEDASIHPSNPYGQTKAMIEQILKDLCAADEDWSVLLLRYFNPIGAHESGMIGEDPRGIPNNLLPYIAKVAGGQLEKIHVFGNDYDTPDGTGVRDYIHVCDLARAHVLALDHIKENPGLLAVNIGTGKGYSVLEVISAFEKACGRKLPKVFDPRRAGDLPIVYADPSLAKKILGFSAKCDIGRMCEDAWRWQCYAD